MKQQQLAKKITAGKMEKFGKSLLFQKVSLTNAYAGLRIFVVLLTEILLYLINTFLQNLPGLWTNIIIYLKHSSTSNLFPGTTIFSLNKATCSSLPVLCSPLEPFTIFQQEHDEIFRTPVCVKPLKSKDWLICWKKNWIFFLQ